MKKNIKEKIDKFVKIALILSILSILIQGALKLIFDVNWFNLEVNQRLSDFFLFKNIIVQQLINQIFFMFSFIIIVAISNKSSILSVINKTWYLLIATYLLNFFDKNISFIITPFIGLIISIFYYLKNKSNIKIFWKMIMLFIISTIIINSYQTLTLLIRFNEIPQTDRVYSFYEQIVFVIDVNIFSYFYYRLMKARC